MKFDEAIDDHIGPFGPWQKLVLLSAALTILPATPMLMNIVQFTPQSR